MIFAKYACYGALGIVWSLAGMGITTPFYWISLLLLLAIDVLACEITSKKKE